MTINVDETRGLITLTTRRTAYQMKVDEIGTLLHTHYGAPIGDSDMSLAIVSEQRGFSSNPYELAFDDRSYSLDLMPLEYSTFGTGDYRITGLHVRNADGSIASRLRFRAWEITPGKYGIPGLPAVFADEDEADTLTITLSDPESGLEVELFYGVLESLDVICRAARITNGGTTPIELEKAASVSLDLPFGDWDWVTFWGRHTLERQFQRAPIVHGTAQIGSVRGISSHHYNPASIICEPAATETTGRCYGCTFMYSGEFSMEVERDETNLTRLLCSIMPNDFRWPLAPGESFSTPEAILTFSDAGFERISHTMHRLIRDHVCRSSWTHRRRPVLINNWEATYFNFNGRKLIELADEARTLGIELFVMDDGWFGDRNDDDRALGDWFPNEGKLGMPLAELAEEIRSRGLAFGIWVEPEAISENSDLYRAHPDWVIAIPGRRPAVERRQLVLDYTRADVRDHIVDALSALLGDNPISYVKWDMNRAISDKYSNALDAAHQGEFAHRYVLGLYDVLERLTSRFPSVLFEGCSGGGGRFDAGMLYYTPQIWCSDNTDAFDRLSIQHGTSFMYPISAVGAHVSAIPNHQTGRTEPLKTRGVVAMAGTFGYELDVTKLSDAEKAEVVEQIAIFDRFYDLIQYGDYYRLTTPDYCAVWEMAAPDGSEALVSAVYHYAHSAPAPIHVSVRGLIPDATYRVDIVDKRREEEFSTVLLPGAIVINIKDGFELTGEALQNGGLTIPRCFSDGQAWQIHIHRTDGDAER